MTLDNAGGIYIISEYNISNLLPLTSPSSREHFSVSSSVEDEPQSYHRTSQGNSDNPKDPEKGRQGFRGLAIARDVELEEGCAKQGRDERGRKEDERHDSYSVHRGAISFHHSTVLLSDYVERLDQESVGYVRP